MTFEEILPVVKAGGRARRTMWADHGTGWELELAHPLLPDGRPMMPLLIVLSEDGVMRPFSGANWDLLADDWIIAEETT